MGKYPGDKQQKRGAAGEQEALCPPKQQRLAADTDRTPLPARSARFALSGLQAFPNDYHEECSSSEPRARPKKQARLGRTRNGRHPRDCLDPFSIVRRRGSTTREATSLIPRYPLAQHWTPSLCHSISCYVSLRWFTRSQSTSETTSVKDFLPEHRDRPVASEDSLKGPIPGELSKFAQSDASEGRRKNR